MGRTKRDARIIKYADCGAFGHAWFETPDYDWRPEFGTPMVLRCERCPSERHDTLDTFGFVTQRNYKYPMDYSWKGEQRPSRADFRLAVVAKRKQRRLKLVANDAG